MGTHPHTLPRPGHRAARRAAALNRRGSPAGAPPAACGSRPPVHLCHLFYPSSFRTSPWAAHQPLQHASTPHCVPTASPAASRARLWCELASVGKAVPGRRGKLAEQTGANVNASCQAAWRVPAALWIKPHAARCQARRRPAARSRCGGATCSSLSLFSRVAMSCTLP